MFRCIQIISDSGFFTFKTRRFRSSNCHVQDFKGLKSGFFDRLGITRDIKVSDMSGIYSQSTQVSQIGIDDIRETNEREQHRGSKI